MPGLAHGSSIKLPDTIINDSRGIDQGSARLPPMVLVRLDARGLGDSNVGDDFSLDARVKLGRRHDQRRDSSLGETILSAGTLSALIVSALSLSMMGCGVLAGASIPIQIGKSESL